MLCSAVTEQQDTPGDPGQVACNAATYATEGIKKVVVSQIKLLCYDYSEICWYGEDKCFRPHFFPGDTVEVVYSYGTDTTPVRANTAYYYNGFTGFRI